MRFAHKTDCKLRYGY